MISISVFVRRHRLINRAPQQAGFSIIELSLVVAILGILAALATPQFLSYYQGARLRAGAQVVAALLNQGRQLAINDSAAAGVCVQITDTGMRFLVGGCLLGEPWVGPGTDPLGYVGVPRDVKLTMTTADPPVFSYLGAANRPATYAVTDRQTNDTLQVKVAVSGRVCIAPSTSCP